MLDTVADTVYIYMNLFRFQTALRISLYCYPSFLDEETETYRYKVPYP